MFSSVDSDYFSCACRCCESARCLISASMISCRRVINLTKPFLEPQDLYVWLLLQGKKGRAGEDGSPGLRGQKVMSTKTSQLKFKLAFAVKEIHPYQHFLLFLGWSWSERTSRSRWSRGELSLCLRLDKVNPDKHRCKENWIEHRVLFWINKSLLFIQGKSGYKGEKVEFMNIPPEFVKHCSQGLGYVVLVKSWNSFMTFDYPLEYISWSLRQNVPQQESSEPVGDISFNCTMMKMNSPLQ